MSDRELLRECRDLFVRRGWLTDNDSPLLARIAARLSEPEDVVTNSERWKAGVRLGFPEYCSHWEGRDAGWYHELTGTEHHATAEDAIDAAQKKG